jgi:hypothetical protein
LKAISQDSNSDDDLIYKKEKTDKFVKKKQNLWDQRLRGRFAKTKRIRNESATEYSENINGEKDKYAFELKKFWDDIKDKNPQEVRTYSYNLFNKSSKLNEKGGRRTKTRRTRQKTRRPRQMSKGVK